MEREQRYVGIDFHRRRLVIVHKDAAGEVSEAVHLDNDPVAFARELKKAGEHPEVVHEACYGWYWLADLLDEMGQASPRPSARQRLGKLQKRMCLTPVRGRRR